jgi:hypothetical protein
LGEEFDVLHFENGGSFLIRWCQVGSRLVVTEEAKEDALRYPLDGHVDLQGRQIFCDVATRTGPEAVPADDPLGG